MIAVAKIGSGPLWPVVLFVKSILGGVAALLLVWVAILASAMWRLKIYSAKQGLQGLSATADGWTMLMRSPSVILLLAAAFGVGFYLVARFSTRS